MEIARLIAPVQHYAWGSREAIPRLLGRAPDGRPWAEVWMGAHPRAPARLVRGGEGAGERAAEDAGDPLDRVIAAAPDEVLGAEVRARFGTRLPYLFKVLAADRPLSIQCHPDAEAARRGFAREEERGVPRDAPERTYRDPSHKPELIAALGPFEALVGFRPPDEIGRRLAVAAGRALAGPLAALASGGLEGLFRALMALSPAQAEAALVEAVASLAGAPEPEAAWVRRLAAAFPRDPAALAPLYLNHVELAADQALYLGAGVLHAYLGGVGLEIMASSDNVLRGGLTDKHVDMAELCRVARFEPLAPRPLTPEPGGDGRLRRYPTPAAEFELGFVDLGAGPYRRAGGRPEIVLALGGGAALAGEGSTAAVALGPGQAALVPASAGPYRLEGEGRAYIATVP